MKTQKEIDDLWQQRCDAVNLAPVFRTIAGNEIVKVGVDYWVREPGSDEPFYRSTKYKRVAEVARECPS
jgi:hypothetical protein